LVDQWRLGRRWLREGRPLELPGAPAAAYRIRDPFPVVSVVGILRSRLFVAEQVVERLSKSELEAVLAHEAGHLAAHDNLKRLALRLAPTLPPAGARWAGGSLGAGRRGSLRRPCGQRWNWRRRW
jgi:Zn-dependent protease with chaperone function